MAGDVKVITDKQEIVAIADSIRNKTGTTEQMTLSEIKTRIDEISGTEDLTAELAAQAEIIAQLEEAVAEKAVVSPVLEILTVTENGSYKPDEGIDGFSEVVVDVTGSGGSAVETCTATISFISPPGPKTFYYTDGATLQTITVEDDTAITVMKNSVMAINGWSAMSYENGLCEQIFYMAGCAAYKITGNCEFKISD